MPNATVATTFIKNCKVSVGQEMLYFSFYKPSNVVLDALHHKIHKLSDYLTTLILFEPNNSCT
jgi:hypothetical protein